MFKKRQRAAEGDQPLVRPAPAEVEEPPRIAPSATPSAAVIERPIVMSVGGGASQEPRSKREEVSEPVPHLIVENAEDRGIDQSHERDHRAILERNEEIGRRILAGELSRNVYRGQQAYAPVLQKREGAIAANKFTGAYGPLRASGTLYNRTTTRMDYNPELCKDYNETGYCGFGDTCKFIHDRYDYKAGWQLENEWESEQKKKQAEFRARLAGVKPNARDDSSDYGSD